MAGALSADGPVTSARRLRQDAHRKTRVTRVRRRGGRHRRSAQAVEHRRRAAPDRGRSPPRVRRPADEPHHQAGERQLQRPEEAGRRPPPGRRPAAELAALPGPAATTSATSRDRRARRSAGVEPARSALGVRVTSSISTRTAAGAVLKTSSTKPAHAGELARRPSPAPRRWPASAWMRMAHCSAKTLSSSSSLFRK